MSDTGEPTPPTAASVARFGGIMVFSLFLSRVLGMLRDTVMAAKFGIGLEADSYRVAVQIPDMIFMLIAGGGLSSAFIPVFAELLHKKREQEAWRVFGIVVTASTIAAASLVAIAWALAPAIVGYFSVGKDPQVIPGAIQMSRIMLPAQIAFLVGSILLGTLYARKMYAVPGLAPNVYNVGIILGALLLPPLAGFGIESMAWGALVGAIVGNLVLPTLAMLKVGSHFKPSLDFTAPGVDKFFKLLVPVVLGFSLPSMVNIITQKFASLYGGAGVNTVLALSNNLMQAPLGIFGQALAIAAFPVLAEFVATDRMDLYRQQVSKTLRTVLYLGIPSGALMLALAPQIVHVLYGYGVAAQNAANLQATADCLRLYSLGVFVWCMQPVLMRGFFSLHKTLKPVAISTGLTLLFIALCVAANRFSPDYRLLPIATDISAAILAVVLFFALEKDVGRLDRPGILATIILGWAAAAVAGGVCFGLMTLLHPSGKALEAVELIFVGMVGIWIYFGITRWMKMPETDYLDRAIARVTRKARS